MTMELCEDCGKLEIRGVPRSELCGCRGLKKVCVMTAVTDSGDGHHEFLGVVVGATLEGCRQKARRKWKWYGLDDPMDRYYCGHPRVTTRWMNVGDLRGGGS